MMLLPFLSLPAFLAAILLCLLAGFVIGFFLARYRPMQRIATLEAEKQAATEAQSLLQQHYEQSQREMKAQFQALASDVLERSTGRLRETNQEQLQAVLEPLRDQMKGLQQAVKDTQTSGADQTATLREMIRLMMERAESIGQDAVNLTRALKGDSKIQGDWGEMVLEQMLERSGLHAGEHFDLQATYTTAEGRRLRPDVVIHFPQGRRVVIDAKVSLTAYAEYMAAEDEDSRQAALGRHLQSVRKHLAELAEKHYEQVVEQALDYVLMFIPNEAAYIAAVQYHPTLLPEAMDRRILIISPSNLVMTLQLACYLWRNETQERNIRLIVEQGRKLYDQFARFQEAFNSIEAALAHAGAAYELARNRLYAGRGNYLGQVDKLRRLGISSTKRLTNPLGDGEDAPGEEEATSALADK